MNNDSSAEYLYDLTDVPIRNFMPPPGEYLAISVESDLLYFGESETFKVVFELYAIRNEEEYCHSQFYTMKHQKPEATKKGQEAVKMLLLAARKSLKIKTKEHLKDCALLVTINYVEFYKDKSKKVPNINTYKPLTDEQKETLKLRRQAKYGLPQELVEPTPTEDYPF